MEILEYYKLTPEKRELLRKAMDQCDWDAGDYLAWMLETDSFKKTCGESSEVLLLVENGELASFCTFAEFDEIEDDVMKPWIGFVYTFPSFRGRRCAGKLIEYAVGIAREKGIKKVFVSSEERGLYEKYGFTFLETRRSVHGYETGVFVREIG